MSEKQGQAVSVPPSDQNTPSQDRGIFHQQHRAHQSHHYMSTYGGRIMNAFAVGFGATLGADAANAAVGEVKQWWR